MTPLDPDDLPEHLLIFAHGKESGPWGTKITALAGIARAQGFAVTSPDYSDQPDPDLRVARLLALAPKARKALVLAGSSMGGYVSAMAAGALTPDALFLIAPALYFPGYDREPPPPPDLTQVVHGWGDDVVTPDKALRYAAKHRVALTLLDAGHTLNERLPELGMRLAELLNLAKLRAAYRLADYRIELDHATVTRRVGVIDAAADRHLASAGVARRWAIVTACNPHGAASDDGVNAARVAALQGRLATASVRHRPAVSRDPDGLWPDEASELLIDPPEGLAVGLGREFGQNAIVTGELGEAPVLRWLR